MLSTTKPSPDQGVRFSIKNCTNQNKLGFRSACKSEYDSLGVGEWEGAKPVVSSPHPGDLEALPRAKVGLGSLLSEDLWRISRGVRVGVCKQFDNNNLYSNLSPTGTLMFFFPTPPIPCRISTARAEV
jgi:hypothetical protein